MKTLNKELPELNGDFAEQTCAVKESLALNIHEAEQIECGLLARIDALSGAKTTAATAVQEREAALQGRV
jgi:hypothetical protein